MPEDKPKLIQRVLKNIGYVPIREASQTHPDLAASLAWEPTPPKTVDYLDTYERAIWTYAAIYRIATSGAKVPFKIYKKRITKEGQRTEVIGRLVNSVFETPNPYATRFDLWEASLAFGELCGDSYWELVARSDEPPEEFYVLRPDRIEIKPDVKKLIGQYDFEVNGRKIIFQPEDILHFKYFSSKSDLYGTSASAAAEKSIILDLYAIDFNARFFKAGARIMGVLEADRHLSDKAYKRLERKWTKYSGYQRAFKTPILEEGLKWKGVTQTHTDMEFIQQRKLIREEILAGYGVHPAIVGLFEYCIAKGEKVLLASGEEVEIEKLKPGQEVLNFNIKENRFEKHKIKEAMPRGKRQVYELRTGNRKIKATDNHPFLTLAPGINPAYPRKPEWKKLKDLKKGDLIAILTEVPDWMGQGNNHLPDGTVASEDLMEQLGLYVGDGHNYFGVRARPADRKLGKGGNGISFALPKNDPNREYYERQAERVWEYKQKYKDGWKKTKPMHPMRVYKQETCFDVCSAKAVKQIYDWGFSGTARTKRVPTWVFELDKNLKKAFLRGYFNSDGGHLKHKRVSGSIHERIQVAASNEILVEQIRDLCIQVGYSATNVNEQHRVTNYGQNDLWRFLICNRDGKRVGCVTSRRARRYETFPNGINWASIRSIKKIGEKETYDLEIENVHNFFTSGIAVMNSNYANAEAQKKLFWEDTMVPKLIKKQETITSFLLPRYGPRLVGEFDLSTIPALHETEQAKAQIAEGLVDSGIMTRNEARHKFYELPGGPGGDKFTIRGKYITIAEGEESEESEEGMSVEELGDFISTLRKRLQKRIRDQK